MGRKLVKKQASQPKRLKVVLRGDTWVDAQVFCDGKPLDALSVSVGVNVDQQNTVSITFDAFDVQLDLQTPDHGECWVEAPESA